MRHSQVSILFNLKDLTFPNFAREDGSEVHEALPSVSLFLLKETLLKFPGKPWLALLPGVFFPTDGICLCNLLGSTRFPFVVAMFADRPALFSSLKDFEDTFTLVSSLGGNLSLVDFLATCAT